MCEKASINNSLAEKNIELAKQWHPTKNGIFNPYNVAVNSNKKVWWLYSYDDPVTGKHFDFEWKASVNNRNRIGLGCPFLSGSKVWKGFNDLETLRPDKAKYWHPSRNNTISCSEVSIHSEKKVWWLYPYDDPITGKHYDFEWKQSINNYIKSNGDCPYITNERIWSGYNDLQTKDAETVKYWHPTQNGSLKPDECFVNSTQKVWWLYPYDDPITGNHFDFEWQDTIVNMVHSKNKCPFLVGKRVWKGFNDLETLCPELVKEWHPTKNGKLTTSDLTISSNKKVWWLHPYDDPITGNHFDFEWQASVSNRVYIETACPFISGNKVWRGFNDLVTLQPNLAREWHPTKNGGLTPFDVTVNCNKKVWWLYPYDDPNTGKHYDFEWQATVYNRANHEQGCPFITGRAAWKGFNDLEYKRPDIAKYWHPSKNGKLKPYDVCCKSNKKVWWLYPYDDPLTGKHYDFEWQQSISSYTSAETSECPFITGRKVWKGYNDIATKNPELISEWDYTRNKKKPENYTSGSNTKVWWIGLCGHNYRTKIASRCKQGTGCPVCNKYKIYKI